MALSDDDDIVGHLGEDVASVPIDPNEGAKPIDLDLLANVESARKAANATKSAMNLDASEYMTGGVASDIITGLASKLPSGGLEDVSRSSSPDGGEEFNASSGLDREVSRLSVLKTYLGVLHVDHGIKFDRLTALACRFFQARISMITIDDLNKQHHLSIRRTDSTLSNAAITSHFCTHVVMDDCDLMVVNDASKDIRFANNPEVTGHPCLRFYAGTPLISPEGHRLGTMCVMDTEPRTDPVTMEEKQSLMELAAMAMETLEALRMKNRGAAVDPSQQIACAAHDLLTPLTGIALSLSLLKEDDDLTSKLTEQQRDMIETAANCSTFMNSICHRTMDFFRVETRSSDSLLPLSPELSDDTGRDNNGPPVVHISDLIKNLNIVMEPFPKRVPIIYSVDSNVPPEFIGDDMKIFRSASNFLTNACAKTESGSIRFRILKRANPEKAEDELIFECEDTGPGVAVSKYGNLFKPVFADPLLPVSVESTNHDSLVDASTSRCRGLGLYSVATQIESMGGKYGFRPRDASSENQGPGSVFWFSIPIVLPSEILPRALPRVVDPVMPLGSSMQLTAGRASVPDNVARRLRSLLGIEAPPFNGIKRSENSLNKLSSEEALVAYAAKRSTSGESMRNETFSSQGTPARPTQALVIEDSVVVRKNMARVLSKLGFEVTQAVNGMEGLRELKNSLFDLVLCDFLMPVMDGLDCVQQYRQWESGNRPFFKQYIIGISAHANEKDIEQGFKMGMNGFRSKPLTFRDVDELRRSHAFKRTRSELDKLGHEMEALKRRKLEPPRIDSSSTLPGLSHKTKVCLVIEDSPSISKLAEIASKTIGWTIVPIVGMDSAIRLLKMRNWDAILVDGDFAGHSHTISMFREWEKRHRVNRQRNIMLLTTSYVSPGGCDTFQVPTGFDGALAKPIELDSLQLFFQNSKSSWEIISR